jgi:hypothetical protein
MSVANFGPTYKSIVVGNEIGAIAIAANPAGNPTVVYELLQTAAAAPIRLVVPAGTYAIHCRAILNPNNAASVIGCAQCALSVVGGGELAGSQTISGGYANGANFSYFFTIDKVVSVATATSFSFTFGITASDTAHAFIAGQTSMTATRLSD